jgi:hypothetical protein
MMRETDEIAESTFLSDIRRGLTDDELAAKYRLSNRGLGTLFRSLVDAELIGFSELLRRFPGRKDLPEIVAEFRTSRRHHLRVSLPVHDAARPSNQGVICDVSDEGVGVRGIEVLEDEIKTLVVPEYELFRLGPVIFQAVCTWFRNRRGMHDHAAGFMVVEVLKGSLKELRTPNRVLISEESTG